MLKKLSASATSLAFLLLSSGLSVAADTTLPNGASSLREQYADWTVLCSLVTDSGKIAKVCSMQQEQARQVPDGPILRVLAIELQPKDKGLHGVLVLPLGMKIDNGAMLRVDSDEAALTVGFRTCVSAGCLVDIDADVDMMAAFSSGKAITVKTVTDDGKDTDFSISLSGFHNALGRVIELSK